MKRKPITLDTSPEQTIELLAQGNQSIKNLLTACASIDPFILLHLDDMNMRYGQIWIAFTSYCEWDMAKFIACIVSRNVNMINKVNQEWLSLGHSDIAIPRGGAPRQS